ncbi:hypothetical protein D6789_01190 [Candidatus Woesearchaeota archaeon]|nr:MAG: hypothetical protein D6789_01190 [Candidatus Woesearchaeota archaeon]
MNKRAVLGEVFPWVARLIIAAALMIFLLLQIWMVTETTTTSKEMELDIYMYRLLAGPHGILYRDPVDDPKGAHPVPWVIDEARITTTQLENEDPYTEYPGAERYGARIRLYNRAQDINRTPVREAYHHKPVYDAYASFGRAGLSMAGGALYKRHVFPVTVRSYNQGTKEYTDTTKWLDIEVVRRVYA